MKENDKKEKKEIVLTPEEAAAIESQRADVENLNIFREGYAKLVEQTGFMWAVDLGSTLNNIQLGISRKPLDSK